jgi:hypothetical protein
MGQKIPFLNRLKIAWRVLLHGNYAADLMEGLKELEAKQARTMNPPEWAFVSALMLLSVLQR